MPKISQEAYQARRRHILDAARGCFSRAGIHVSVDEICSAAGVSKGAFYGYFKSKDALFEALAADHGELLREQASIDDRLALRAMIHDRLSLVAPAYARVELDSWAYAMHHAALNRAFARNSDALEQAMAGALGRIGGLARLPADEAATLVQLATAGAFVQLALKGEAAVAPVTQAIDRLLDLVLGPMHDDADALQPPP